MISLRLIISGLFILLTLATAGTILGVFLSFTTKATNEIADAHIKALADNTGLAIEGWMEKAVGEHTAMQRWFYTQSFPHPSEIRANATDKFTYMDFMHNHAWGILSSAGYSRESGIVIGYADHSLTYTSAVSPATMIKVTYAGHSFEPVGVYNSSLDDRLTDVHLFANHKIGIRVDRSVTSVKADVHTAPWWNKVPHDVPLSVVWDDEVRLTGSPSIACSYVLHTRDDVFYGIMTNEIDIGFVQTFLLQAERSENTHSFLLSNVNGIIATTHNTTLQVILNSTDPEPPGMGCTVSILDQGGYFPMECRYTIAGFPYPPLQAAINTTDAVDMLTVADSSIINSRRVKSNGDTYFVAVKQLRVTNGSDYVFPTLRWKVVYIMKETDITGPVVKGRNISIIAACCVFLFFNLVAFVLLAVLLAPLRVVAEEMEVTSRLQDLGEPDGDLSFISEVANLETSYRALKAQLRRIRSFVPAGLLAQLDGDADEDDEDEREPAESTVKNDNASLSDDNHSAALSRRSARSTKSSHQGGLAAGGPVALDVALTKKKVAVVHIRLAGFRVMMGSTNLSDRHKAAAAHAELLNYIVIRCKELRGVIDSYQDDTIIVTFNLSIQAGLAPRSAVTLAMNVTTFVAEHPSGFLAYCGVSHHYVIAGTLGTADMKRQCLVGAPYEQAEVLARLAQKCEYATLCPVRTLHETVQIQFAVADVVPLPGEARCVIGVPTLLPASDDSKDMEWMYDLEQGEKNNKYTAGNNAVKALLETGETIKADAYTKTSEHRSFEGHHRDYALELIKKIQSSPNATQYVSIHEDFLSSLVKQQKSWATS